MAGHSQASVRTCPRGSVSVLDCFSLQSHCEFSVQIEEGKKPGREGNASVWSHDIPVCSLTAAHICTSATRTAYSNTASLSCPHCTLGNKRQLKILMVTKLSVHLKTCVVGWYWMDMTCCPPDTCRYHSLDTVYLVSHSVRTSQTSRTVQHVCKVCNVYSVCNYNRKPSDPAYDCYKQDCVSVSCLKISTIYTSYLNLN